MELKIVLIGSGGREDALARRLKESGGKIVSIMTNDNPSIRSLSEKVYFATESEVERILDIIKEESPDLVYVSPDSFLETPIVDKLEYSKIRVASPSSRAFRIESSKIYMRQLMKRYGITGNIKFEIFDSEYEVGKYLDDLTREFAIKPAGLTGGKGVKLTDAHFSNREEAKEYAYSIIRNDRKVLIEEKVEGEEFSLQAFTDGTNLIFTPIAQDYKRLKDGDEGPNTGGMGSITDRNGSLPFLRQESVDKAKEILHKFVKSLYDDGALYRGVIYGQFMQTNKDVKVIEINGRLADPEGINIMTLLEGDACELLMAVANAELAGKKFIFRRKSSVVKYIVPKGYGVNPEKTTLKINRENMPDDVKIFYGSVSGSLDEVETSHSRALAIYAEGETIWEASEKIEANLWRISGEYEMRHDIGSKKSLARKVENATLS
ncbi:phosphoribosylamine--glycine ligase [Cuniculiplasma sp. SKW3]|uniref:phosphoribosylamine--glycine ligase n=1 Tax=Cuniculiplasma sp. SKW3 TaxID=3400170 RepID=UPI003FD3E86C